MKFKIPDFMAETSSTVELTLNVDVTPEEYAKAAETMIAYAHFREGQGDSPGFYELAKAISDVILFDGKKLNDQAFLQLINGEMITLNEFCIYLTQVMVRIGAFAEATKWPTEGPAAA